MKDKNLLKQNLLIFTALILCWLLLLINDLNFDFLFSGYIILWLISLVYSFFFLPFSYIQYKRIMKGKNIEKPNKAFRIISWIFIFLFIAPVIYDLGYEIFTFYEPGLSFLTNIYIDVWVSFKFITLKGVFIWTLHTLPFLIVIILFYQSIKLNKRLKTS